MYGRQGMRAGRQGRDKPDVAPGLDTQQRERWLRGLDFGGLFAGGCRLGLCRWHSRASLEGVDSGFGVAQSLFQRGQFGFGRTRWYRSNGLERSAHLIKLFAQCREGSVLLTLVIAQRVHLRWKCHEVCAECIEVPPQRRDWIGWRILSGD
ncbi:hypothetical protein METHP14_70068 [Pseudomonas sp. P14-2025]